MQPKRKDFKKFMENTRELQAVTKEIKGLGKKDFRKLMPLLKRRGDILAEMNIDKKEVSKEQKALLKLKELLSDDELDLKKVTSATFKKNINIVDKGYGKVRGSDILNEVEGMMIDLIKSSAF